jgi:hypothetical protein
MTSRVRNLTMFVVLLAWSAYVGAVIWRDQTPDPLVWGVPAGAYAALYQPWKQRREADQEGDGS